MDWNQCSDDSWLSSSQQQQKGQEEQPKKDFQKQSPQQKQEVAQTESDQKIEKNKQKEVPKQKRKKGEYKNQDKKFPTDNQLLQQYESGKVQDSQRLNIINCFEKEEIQMLESLDKNKQLRLRQFKNKKNCYAAKFWSKEDLIKFIKQKIQKKYKFKIGIYIESQNEKKWKAEKQKQRAQLKAKQNQQKQKQKKQYKDQKQKQKKQYKDQKQKQKKQYKDQKSKIQYRAKDEELTKGKQQDKKHFRKQKDQEPENYKKSQNKQSTKQYKQKGSKPQSKNIENKDQRRQHPHHKDYKGQQKKHKGPIKNLKRQNQRSNKVELLSQEASPSQVCQWIKYQKIPSQFKQFTLIAPGRFNVYMEKISQQIHKTLGFGLVSDISQEQCEQKLDQLFQFVYHENYQPKHIKRTLHGVFIDKVSQQNFDTVQKFYTHIIGLKNDLSAQTNFDQKQYLELFKKNYLKIVTKWQKWVFLAYNKNIAKLLRLSAGLKKSLPKNPFNYEVGVYQKLPFVRVQICQLNKTKYKVDTSVINSHLQD